MLLKIAYFSLWGVPLISFLGAITYLSVLLTILFVVLPQKGIKYLPITWHRRMAAATLALATLHGLLGFIIFLNRF